MKKTLLFLLVFLSMTGLSFAQGVPAVKFQGLDGSFAKFGGMTGGYRSFEIRVDFDPFHFVATGKVAAGPQTEDLDLLSEDIGIAFSYFSDASLDISGMKQYPAISEMVMFVQDEPTRIKDLKVELLPPLSSQEGTTLLASVPSLQKQYMASMTAEARASKEESEITTAIADPWSLSRKEAQKNKAPAAAPAPVVRSMKSEPAPQTQNTIEEPDTYVVTEREMAREPNTNGAPSDKEGYSGSKKNRTWIGASLAAVGGILLIYGVLQHGEMNTKLSKMQDGERAFPGIGNEPYRSMSYDQLHATANAGISGGETYNDLENQKKGAETRRNIALGLGAISIGGSIVMFTF